jgi:uncharacterized protein YegP (UPF0339 family)
MDKVTLYRDASGEWRWRRQSENGLIVATSGEGYHNHDDALNMAREVNGVNHVEWHEDG